MAPNPDLDARIEEVANALWPPYPFDPTDIDKFKRFACEKYGDAVIEKYAELCCTDLSAESGYRAILDFIYTHNITMDIVPHTLARQRETFRVMAHHLSAREPFTLTDLGCGDGLLAIAFAKVLPVSRILAIDYLPSAIERTRQNAKTHDCPILETLTADFRTFTASPARRDNVLLLAYPMEPIQYPVQHMFNEKTECVGAYALDPIFVDMAKEITEGYVSPLKFRVLKELVTLPGERAVIWTITG